MKIERSPVAVGDVFESRGGTVYTVAEVFANGGILICRKSTGKTVKITGSAIRKVIARMANGESFKYQASPPNGGINYTIAIEAGIVYALRDNLLCDNANRQYIVKTEV